MIDSLNNINLTPIAIVFLPCVKVTDMAVGKNIMNFTQIGSFEARPMLILVMAKSIKNK
jgi:hypothetical protein